MRIRISVLVILCSSWVYGSTCTLEAVSGKISGLIDKPIYLKIEYYALPDGFLDPSRPKEYLRKELSLSIGTDGSFAIPAMEFKNLVGLYILPDLYLVENDKKLDLAGMSRLGLWVQMMSYTAFKCNTSKKKYNQEYKDFFSQFLLHAFPAAEAEIKFEDLVSPEEILKKYRKEYLNTGRFYTQLEVGFETKGKSQGVGWGNFESYMGGYDQKWQGVESCDTPYTVCLGTTEVPDTMKMGKYSLRMGFDSAGDRLVSIVPIAQMVAKPLYDLNVRVQLVVFKKGVSHYWEKILFRKGKTGVTYESHGGQEEIDRRHVIVLDEIEFCPFPENPQKPHCERWD